MKAVNIFAQIYIKHFFIVFIFPLHKDGRSGAQTCIIYTKSIKINRHLFITGAENIK
jgi:hypothetical protein